MLRFFRQFRQRFLSENKFSKYLLYAIGEILLVVIGILIALQINNWNENKTKSRQLEQILSIVARDLKTDLVNSDESIAFYEELEGLLMDIITIEYPESYFEKINAENYAESLHSRSRISIGRSFYTQEKGIELLNSFIDNNSTVEEGLSQEITQFYATEARTVQKSSELVLSFAKDNFKYLEQYPWFKDYIIEKYNPETVRFFANDPSYKNKAASFLVLAVRTYLRNLKTFRESASELIERIENRKTG